MFRDSVKGDSCLFAAKAAPTADLEIGSSLLSGTFCRSGFSREWKTYGDQRTPSKYIPRS